MATPFKDIVQAAGNNMDRSVQWYQRAVREYARGVNTFQEARQTDLGKQARNLEVGKMYMFTYFFEFRISIIDFFFRLVGLN